MITVLNFEGAWPVTTVASTNITPTTCRTASYTAATANEVAVFQLSGSALQATSATLNIFRGAPAFSTNGGSTFTFAATQYNLDQLNGGVASISSTVRIPLTQGTSYIFAPIFQTTVGVALTAASCHGTILIVRN